MRIAGCKGASTAPVLGVDIPALLRKGALEALQGQLYVSSDVASLRKPGVDLSAKVNQTGRYILSVVAFGGGRSDSFSARAFANRSPNLANGGLRLPLTADGMCRFEPP